MNDSTSVQAIDYCKLDNVVCVVEIPAVSKQHVPANVACLYVIYFDQTASQYTIHKVSNQIARRTIIKLVRGLLGPEREDRPT